MAKAVQYRGTPKILMAFREQDVPNWALLLDGKILKKYAGEKMNDSTATLEAFLKSLEASGTTTTYELRLYEDLTDPKKIRPATDPDYAYNVTLFSDEYQSSGQQSRTAGFDRLCDKIDNMELQIAMMKKEEEETEEAPPAEVSGLGGGFIGAINKMLDNPDVQQKLAERFFGFFDKLMSPAPAPIVPMTRQLGAIGSPGDAAPPPITEITQEQMDKIQGAVNILAGLVPNLGDTLMLLAGSAQQDPKGFNKKIGLIKTFL